MIAQFLSPPLPDFIYANFSRGRALDFIYIGTSRGQVLDFVYTNLWGAIFMKMAISRR